MAEPLSVEIILVAAVLVLSAALQTATGFGFAILSAPVLAALLGPELAVSTIVATGVVVDVLVLAADGRRPQPRVSDVLSLGAWSLPGLLAGALLLREPTQRCPAAARGRSRAPRRCAPHQLTAPLGAS